MAIVHGGNIDEIERIYNIPKSEIKDFSGNINPLGASKAAVNTLLENAHTAITTYPDDKYLKLKKSIASYVCADEQYVMVGNGSTELISLYIKTISPKKAIIISPAYSEYEREIKNCKGEVVLFELCEQQNSFRLSFDKLFAALTPQYNLLVICNPNNPTGYTLNRNEIEIILNHCEKHGIFVLIDETYAEFSENESCITLINNYDNLFVVRGTSKFFAVPGLRLGYGLCKNANILEQINKGKDPWSVNSFADLAGIAMFSDYEYISETKKLIIKERNKLFKALEQIEGLRPYTSQSNFLLVKITNEKITSSFVFSELIKEGILIRDASSFPFLSCKFLRVCVLLPEHNNLLIEKLSTLFNKYNS